MWASERSGPANTQPTTKAHSPQARIQPQGKTSRFQASLFAKSRPTPAKPLNRKTLGRRTTGGAVREKPGNPTLPYPTLPCAALPYSNSARGILAFARVYVMCACYAVRLVAHGPTSWSSSLAVLPLSCPSWLCRPPRLETCHVLGPRWGTGRERERRSCMRKRKEDVHGGGDTLRQNGR